MRLSPEEERRNIHERNLWLSTRRPDGRPHLVPIWFAWVAGRWYICTGPESVKARNLQADPRCSWSLENGDTALVFEGTARPVTPTPEVAAAFRAKFDWEIENDPDYSLLFELTPSRKVMGQQIVD